MSILFIADIHLGNEHPEISQRFEEFLRQTCTGVEALYILGDLFEVWIGDDAVQSEHRPTLNTLSELTGNGLPVYIMHGNRDFLLGSLFEKETGCTLITDPVVINLGGTPTLLMHGDSLCTDDKDYQQFRSQVREAEWKEKFLSMPIEKRVAYAQQARNESRRRSKEKSTEIMDVNGAAVISMMRKHGVTQLIHGHTHRPATHDFQIDDTPAQRFVLGDWYTQNSWLIYDDNGCQLHY